MTRNALLLTAALSTLGLSAGTGAFYSHRSNNKLWDQARDAKIEADQTLVKLQQQLAQSKQVELDSTQAAQLADKTSAQAELSISEANQKLEAATEREAQAEALRLAAERSKNEADAAAERAILSAKIADSQVKDAAAATALAARHTDEANAAKIKYKNALSKALRDADKARTERAVANKLHRKSERQLVTAQKLKCEADELFASVASIENELLCAQQEANKYKNEASQLRQTVHNLQCQLNSLRNSHKHPTHTVQHRSSH